MDEEALLQFLDLGRVALAVLDVFGTRACTDHFAAAHASQSPGYAARGVADGGLSCGVQNAGAGECDPPGNWLAAKQSSGVAQPKALVANRAIDIDRDEAARKSEVCLKNSVLRGYLFQSE